MTGGDASWGHLAPGGMQASTRSGRGANLEGGREARNSQGWWAEPQLEERTAPRPSHAPASARAPCPRLPPLHVPRVHHSSLCGSQPVSGSGSEGLRQAGSPREGRSRQQRQLGAGSALIGHGHARGARLGHGDTRGQLAAWGPLRLCRWQAGWSLRAMAVPGDPGGLSRDQGKGHRRGSRKKAVIGPVGSPGPGAELPIGDPPTPRGQCLTPPTRGPSEDPIRTNTCTRLPTPASGPHIIPTCAGVHSEAW